MELNSVGVIYYENQQQKNLASSSDLIAGIDTNVPTYLSLVVGKGKLSFMSCCIYCLMPVRSVNTEAATTVTAGFTSSWGPGQIQLRAL